MKNSFFNLSVILLVSVPFVVNGQCKKEYKKFENGSYFGCFNDSGVRHGEGTYTWSDGDEYVGPWENGKRHGQEGTMTIKDLNTTQVYTGGWKNDKKHGQGILTTTYSDQKQIKTGYYKSNVFWNGTRVIEFNEGLVRTYQYNDGEESEEYISNQRNYYNIEDISGPESETIKLNRIGFKYYMDLKFNGVESKNHCIFDSGAFGVRIGKRLFERLQSEGVKIRDLKMRSKTIGVGGTSIGDYVLFDTIEIGGYIIKNVVARVQSEDDLTLIGVDFFDKFGNVQWNMNQSSLTLTRDKK